MSRIPIFAANWKMNKTIAEVGGFVQSLERRVTDLPKRVGRDFEVVIAPTALHLPELVTWLRNTGFSACAQNCGFEKAGAYTGELSPATLAELSVPYVILGHSERRHVFGESDELVAKRLKGALDHGLKVILCVGEKLDARRAGQTTQVVGRQLEILKGQGFGGRWNQLVVAYEPVWAIGTGETATPAQAQEVHRLIRNGVGNDVRILYGGSANAANAGALMAEEDVDGLLVGGASLDANSFADLIRNGLGLPA